MIFPQLQVEPIVQVGDRTRLSAVKSFATPDEGPITKIEIKPTTASAYFDVTDDKYLDWIYATSGQISVGVRVTCGVGTETTSTATIRVATAVSENLFSTDSDLQGHEPDILNWTGDDKNSFINIHRRVQHLIVDEIQRLGFTDSAGNPYTAAAIVDKEEVHQWAVFWALELIYQGLSNAVDDVFDRKSRFYAGEKNRWASIAHINLDVDGDGTADGGSGDGGINLQSIFVARR